MKFAYADPPYIGQARKRYRCVEVDHNDLLSRLSEYDGWALSCSTPSLRVLLPIAPPDTRIAAWVKPFAVFKPGVNPAYAWEPVLFRGGRKRDRSVPTIRDWHSANITLRKGLCGAKPESFARWIMDILGAEPGEIDDLFPGTGACSRVFSEALAEKVEGEDA